MWKEIVDIDGFNKMASLRELYGCAANIGGEIYLKNKEIHEDCHYYQYKSDTIELIKGYRLKEKDGYIHIITYTIKAEIKDYPEAIRYMAEHAKEYLSTREIKTLVINYGSEDNAQMDLANVGVGKIGFIEFMKIVIDEYEKIGFKTTFDKKQVRNVLM